MHKLVRDKIPEIIQQSGKTCDYAEAKTNEFFIKLLQAKLVEEVQEFLASGEPDELLDIKLVIETMAEALGISKEDFDTAADKKAEDRGKFDKRYILFLEESTKSVEE